MPIFGTVDPWKQLKTADFSNISKTQYEEIQKELESLAKARGLPPDTYTSHLPKLDFSEPTPSPTPTPEPTPSPTPTPEPPKPVEPPPEAPAPIRSYDTFQYYPTPQYKPAYEAFNKPYPVPKTPIYEEYDKAYPEYQTPEEWQNIINTLAPNLRERYLNPPGLPGKGLLEEKTREAIAGQSKKASEALNKQYAAQGLTTSGFRLGAQERLQTSTIQTMSNAQRDIEIENAKMKEQQINDSANQLLNVANMVGGEAGKKYAAQAQAWAAGENEHLLNYRSELQATQDIQNAMVGGYTSNKEEWTKVFDSISNEAIRHTAYESEAYKQKYAEYIQKIAYQIAEKTGQWDFYASVIGAISKIFSGGISIVGKAAGLI